MTSDNSTSRDAELLAQRLREAREFANLSQQFVADQTGIPRTAVSDIERGTRRVESLELKRLAELYRMPVSFFLGDDSDADFAGAPEDPAVTALARATSALSENEKSEVLRFALFLQRFEPKGADPS